MGGSRDSAAVFGFLNVFVFLMIPFWRLVVQHYPITDRDIDRIQQSLVNFASGLAKIIQWYRCDALISMSLILSSGVPKEKCSWTVSFYPIE